MKEKLAGFSSNKEVEMNKSLDAKDIMQQNEAIKYKNE